MDQLPYRWSRRFFITDDQDATYNDYDMQLSTVVYTLCIGSRRKKIHHAARVTKNNAKWQFHFVVQDS